MGHPKKHRKKYSRPLKPWDKNRIEKDSAVLKQYGLRRKHEIWRAEEMLREFRGRARELLTAPNEKLQAELFQRLNTLGIKAAKLDDILSLKLDDLLARRLQTILVRKGIASTPRQARQLITHRHVIIDGRKVWWPSYIVPVDEEGKIELDENMKKAIIEQSNAEKAQSPQ